MKSTHYILSFCILFVYMVFITACVRFMPERDGAMWRDNILIFQNTPAWELVNAIENENIESITTIIADNPKLLSYEDTIFGITPLVRAVGMRKYKAVQALIALGVDVNQTSEKNDGAIFEAIYPGWNNIEDTNKMLELLLEHNANPNLQISRPLPPPGKVVTPINGTTPLMLYITLGKGVETAKLLVEFGANINLKNRYFETAAINALILNDIETAHYLIVEKNADLTEPYYYPYISKHELDFSRPFYAVDLLMDLIYDLNSNQYKLKKEIVNVLEQQGISYKDAKKRMSEHTLKHIQFLYPNDWEEYIKKY